MGERADEPPPKPVNPDPKDEEIERLRREVERLRRENERLKRELDLARTSREAAGRPVFERRADTNAAALWATRGSSAWSARSS